MAPMALFVIGGEKVKEVAYGVGTCERDSNFVNIVNDRSKLLSVATSWESGYE